MPPKEGRTSLGRFPPGVSGNPKGRALKPPEILAVEAAARIHTMEALDTLVACMRCDDPRVRVIAANSILDRGHGKPMQSISGRIEHLDITAAHLEALQHLTQRHRGPVTDLPLQPLAIEGQASNQADH